DRGADAMGVSDHERHRHRLAKRPPEAEHDAAHHARSRIGNDNYAHHLPSSSTQPIRRFLQDWRYGREDVAHDSADERQDHNGEDEAGSENADAEGWPAEQPAKAGKFAKSVDERRLDRRLQKRSQREQSPNSVDNAGNPGQELDRNADRSSQWYRTKLGQEHGNPEADRNREDHCDRRCDERAINRSEGAELLAHR